MIDEKKLISYLNDWMFQESFLRYMKNPADTIAECIKAVEEQPKIGEWNLCSDGNNLPKEPEALPTEDDFIERMILDGEFEEYIVMIYGAEKATTLYYIGNGDWYDELSGGDYRVIAWQPLPEPLENANLEFED